MSRRKFLLGLAKRAGLGLLALVALLLAAIVWLTQTAHGRGTLVSLALPRVNALLPGELELRELGRLDLSGVELRGLRVLDPSAREVLRLESVDVAFAARELLDGRIVVPSLRIGPGSADLRDVAEKRRGLVAAFVDPDAPKSPPSTEPPPYVRVDRIELRGLELRLPPAGAAGELTVRGLSLAARFELDRTPAVALERFEAKLERAGARIASVDALRARLERGTTPSRVELAVTLLDRGKLTLSGSGVVPPEPSHAERPVTLALALTGLESGMLATLLRDPALESAFEGAIGATLDVSGTPKRLVARLALESAGGKVLLSARADDFERVDASVKCENFALDRVRNGLPARRVTVELAARADAKDPKRVPVHVELRSSRVDDTALPALSLSASITPDRADGIELDVKDGRSTLRARGDVRFSGAAALKLGAEIERSTIDKWSRFAGSSAPANGALEADLALAVDERRNVDVTGNVRVRELVAGELRVERADVAVRLKGQPDRPTGSVELVVERARAGDRLIPRLELQVKGGPSRYEAALDGDFGDASAKLDLKLERGRDRVAVEAKGEGLVRGQPWKLAVEPTTVTAGGDVTTEGVALEVSGQGLRANGSFSKRGSTLELSTGRIDLAALSPLVGSKERLRGGLELSGRLTGTPAIPVLELTLRGDGLALGERPPLGLKLVAALDAQAGEASAELDVHAGAPGKRSLELAFDLSHRFRPGAGFQRALPDGTLDARLELARLDTELVTAWAKLDALPASGSLRGSIHASGTQADPRLDASFAADATLLGARLKPELRLNYGDGSSRLELSVDDAQGRWLDLAALLAFAGERPSLRDLLARLPRSGSEEAWSLALTLGERRLEGLPGLKSAEVPAALAGSLALEHERGAEPSGQFRFALRPTPELDQHADPLCKADRARVELGGTLGSGRLRAELGAFDRQKELLRAEVEAEVAVAEALGGGGAPELGRIHGELVTRELDLATLPLVCGTANGRLNARATVVDPLGERPELSVEVRAARFSLGTPETIDVTLDASANHELAKAKLALIAKAGRSTIDARLPLALHAGRVRVDENAPLALDVDLRSLPIAPFLPPSGAISYATGSVAGKVHAKGKLSSPDVRGELTLKDVAFTATDLAQPVHGVEGTLAFTQDSLKIENLVLHDRDGELAIQGGARLAGGKQLDVAVDVSARDFPIRQQGQVVATTELEAKVKAAIKPDRTEVKIDLGAVDMWIESLDLRTGIGLEPHPDFVVDGRAPEKDQPDDSRNGDPATAPREPAPAGKAAAKAKSAPDARVTLLELDAHERIWIKRDDFAVKIGAKLDTEISGDVARVNGKVSLLRGYLTLMGKDFEIQKGSTLTFTGSTKPDPALEITAVHQNRRSGEAVSVVIRGRAQKPILTFKLDDKEVSAGEAFQAIYGSQQSNQDPKGTDDQAKAFVGGLTAGLLATTARRELGAAAPIIMIEPGDQAGSGRVRAGFEFDSLVPNFLKDVITGVYFEGIVSKESAESAQQSDARTEAGVLLEFYFPKNFFTAGQYGPGPTWSMDVGWQL